MVGRIDYILKGVFFVVWRGGGGVGVFFFIFLGVFFYDDYGVIVYFACFDFGYSEDEVIVY